MGKMQSGKRLGWDTRGNGRSNAGWWHLRAVWGGAEQNCKLLRPYKLSQRCILWCCEAFALDSSARGSAATRRKINIGQKHSGEVLRRW